jgi:hypothetical protein
MIKFIKKVSEVNIWDRLFSEYYRRYVDVTWKEYGVWVNKDDRIIWRVRMATSEWVKNKLFNIGLSWYELEDWMYKISLSKVKYEVSYFTI